MPEPQVRPDFDKIRAQARAINALYGGKIEINEWQFEGDDCLKVILVWKKKRESAVAST